MGIFSFLEKIPIIGDAIKTVGGFAKPIVNTVSNFAKPLWNIGKKVGKFIPGASEAMEAVEGIGGELLGGIEDDIQEAGHEIEDMGETVRDASLGTYRQTRDELEEGAQNLRRRGRKSLGRATEGFGKLKKVGGDLLTTLRNPTKWKEHYGADEEDEEDNNLKMARKKAREKRRRQRRMVEEDL